MNWSSDLKSTSIPQGEIGPKSEIKQIVIQKETNRKYFKETISENGGITFYIPILKKI